MYKYLDVFIFLAKVYKRIMNNRNFKNYCISLWASSNVKTIIRAICNATF